MLDARLDARALGVPIGLPADIPVPLLQLEWCAPFTGVTRRALHALKYDAERRLAPPLGAAIARRWERAGRGRGRVRAGARVARIGCASAGTTRRRCSRPKRAGGCAPGGSQALERMRATTAQFDLDRAARSSNLGGAFRIVDRRYAGCR